MKKINLFILSFLITSVAISQNGIVMNDNVFMVIGDTSYLVIDNKKDNASCIPSPAKKLKKVNSLAQIRRHSDMRNGSGLLNSNRRHSDLRDIIEEQDEDHDDKTRNRVRSSSIDSNGSLGMTIELSEQLSEMMARLGIFLDGQDEIYRAAL